MSITELIEKTGLSAKDFSDAYDIPYRTIQNWIMYDHGNRESGRKAPSYVMALLNDKVSQDLQFLTEKANEK